MGPNPAPTSAPKEVWTCVGRRRRGLLGEADAGCVGRAVHLDDVEEDALALTERAEDGALEGLLAEEDLRAIVLPQHDTGLGDWVVETDDTLHD